MKYHDVVSIADEQKDFLKIADECSNLKQSDYTKIKAISDIVCAVDESGKGKVMTFMATSSFTSMSSMLKSAIREDERATRKFFDSITESDLDSPVGRVLIGKLKLFYTLKIISSTFDDQNLLNLKKAFTNDD